MTDASLVHQGPAAARQTHVMLIGVGAYDHLHGGTKVLTPDHFGLGQLTSPPVSARALADWFITSFDCPDRPLGTVRLLLSESAPSTYTHPVSGTVINVPEAGLVGTRAGVQTWAEGEVSSDDQLILYFCGHGLSAGMNEIYPLRDFGLNDPADDGPLARAINLNSLAGALATVRASNQLLILDTCREQDALVSANSNGGTGLLFARIGRRGGVPEKMAQCVIHSTEPDNKAGGMGGQPSVCAEALTRVFAGAGARRAGGEWHLKSMAISNAITDLQERAIPAGYARQRSDQTRAANISVRRFSEPPKVPVFIRRQDGGSLAGATVDYCVVGGHPPTSQVATADEWEGAVPVGTHRFVVSNGAAPPQLDVEEPVAPTYVGLEVP